MLRVTTCVLVITSMARNSVSPYPQLLDCLVLLFSSFLSFSFSVVSRISLFIIPQNPIRQANERAVEAACRSEFCFYSTPDFLELFAFLHNHRNLYSLPPNHQLCSLYVLNETPSG